MTDKERIEQIAKNLRDAGVTAEEFLGDEETMQSKVALIRIDADVGTVMNIETAYHNNSNFVFKYWWFASKELGEFVKAHTQAIAEALQ